MSQIKDNVFKAVDSLSKEGIAILDGEGNYIYISPRHAEMYGYTPEELMGKSWQTLYSEENAKLISETVMPKLFEYGSIEQKFSGKMKDGKSIRTRVSLTLLEEGLFCICEDITEQEKMLDKQRNDFRQEIMKVLQD